MSERSDLNVLKQIWFSMIWLFSTLKKLLKKRFSALKHFAFFNGCQDVLLSHNCSGEQWWTLVDWDCPMEVAQSWSFCNRKKRKKVNFRCQKLILNSIKLPSKFKFKENQINKIAVPWLILSDALVATWACMMFHTDASE